MVYTFLTKPVTNNHMMNKMVSSEVGSVHNYTCMYTYLTWTVWVHIMLHLGEQNKYTAHEYVVLLIACLGFPTSLFFVS